MYYEKQLERVKTNPKNTWKILNEVINRKKTIKRSPTDFIVETAIFPIQLKLQIIFANILLILALT
jgi:hypothetical protein